MSKMRGCHGHGIKNVWQCLECISDWDDLEIILLWHAGFMSDNHHAKNYRDIKKYIMAPHQQPIGRQSFIGTLTRWFNKRNI